MPPTVLCVPNISEGRDQAIINQILDTLRTAPGAALLDVDSGQDTNRTVITLAGTPGGVAEAAYGIIGMAAELIDMARHTGSHARMGSADVVPFIPVADITIDECIQLARGVAERVATEVTLPIYLYGYAATRPDRVKLADIRAGEYEGLAEKFKDPAFAPDFGPAEFHAGTGATVIGVRDFLLAYNVNLDTDDVALAKEIAARIRETGSPDAPGKLPACQAGGWVVDAYGCAQVTMNLPNFAVTGLHTAFDAVRAEARSLGADVTGSELIGLAPKQALLDAGRHALAVQGKAHAADTDTIDAAIDYLGLTDKTPFDPAMKIVEFRVADMLGD